MSKVIMKTSIPKGKYCKDCGFLTKGDGLCYIYGYLKYYFERRSDYEREDECKLDYPNGKTILVVEADDDDNL